MICIVLYPGIHKGVDGLVWLHSLDNIGEMIGMIPVMIHVLDPVL